MAPQPNPTVARISIGAVAVLSLWAASGLLVAVKQQPQRDDYHIAEMTARYAAVAAALPPGVTTIGYLSDESLDQPKGQVLFYTAQYALAPLLIAATPAGHEWVLANFAQLPDPSRIAAANNLRLERDLGNGVLLLRRPR